MQNGELRGRIARNKAPSPVLQEDKILDAAMALSSSIGGTAAACRGGGGPNVLGGMIREYRMSA